MRLPRRVHFPDRTKKITWAHMAPMVKRIASDDSQCVVRSHYMPLFSRLGAYSHDTLDQRTFGRAKRAFFEAWAHEASLLPLELHPLMRWRMARARNGDGTYGSMSRFGIDEKSYLDTVLDFVTRNGPTGASDVPGGGKSEGGWWGWSRGKLALETLFDQGLVTTSTRRGFERLYDIPERVIAPESGIRPGSGLIRSCWSFRRAHGAGTQTDLRDYFRLPVAEAKTALAELVESQVLHPSLQG
jgi:hypothetical protein